MFVLQDLNHGRLIHSPLHMNQTSDHAKKFISFPLVSYVTLRHLVAYVSPKLKEKILLLAWSVTNLPKQIRKKDLSVIQDPWNLEILK